MSEVKETVSENTNTGTAQPSSVMTMSAGVQTLADTGTDSGVEQRYQQADYIDVTGGSGTAQYELLGFGVTKLDNSPAAQTTSKRYVNQKSATQKIGSYQFSAPLEFDLVRSEAAIAYIADIGENEKTGAEAEGKYGNGDARKTALGSRYDEVQDMINHISTASASTLASEVKAGKYGNGDTRKSALGL